VSHFAVSAVGRDRPGIVASLSQVLLDLGGDIEDSRLAVRRGHFAAMLIVSAPSEIGSDQLEEGMSPLREELGLDALIVSPVGELHRGEPGAKATHVVTVYGADRPGIVHSVTRALAGEGISIVDLQTSLVGDTDPPVFVMLIEAILPDDVDATALDYTLEKLGDDAGVEVGLREVPAEGPSLPSRRS
jgi:glycine cleavage system transcriptional repressor